VARGKKKSYKDTAEWNFQRSICYGRKAWVAEMRLGSKNVSLKGSGDGMSKAQIQKELEDIEMRMPEDFEWRPWKAQSKRRVKVSLLEKTLARRSRGRRRFLFMVLEQMERLEQTTYGAPHTSGCMGWHSLRPF